MVLGFPGVGEAAHHGMTSYRVDGRIIATVPDAEHWHVMAGESEIRAVAASHEACEEKWWGSRLAAVRVELARIDPAELRELLDDAYRRVSAAGRAARGSSRPRPSRRRRSEPTG
jgi:hypothetical protein